MCVSPNSGTRSGSYAAHGVRTSVRCQGGGGVTAPAPMAVSRRSPESFHMWCSSMKERGGAFEAPECRGRTHDVDRNQAQPRRGVAQTREQGSGDEQGRHEGELTELDADIEREQRERDLTVGQPDLAQRARESETVQEAERHGHEPGHPAEERAA